MTWNYRIIRHEDGAAGWLGLHEVFYDEMGSVKNWTAEPITFVADPDEGIDGIAGALELAAADARRHPVLTYADILSEDIDAYLAGEVAAGRMDVVGEDGQGRPLYEFRVATPQGDDLK